MYGVVGNVREYTRHVQDETPKMQAQIHKGRWPTVHSVAKANKDRIVKDFQDEIKKLVKG